jgi:hypothetical protein
MAFRGSNEIAAATKEAFGHLAGWPATRFDDDKLLAFALACCQTPAEGCAAGGG